MVESTQALSMKRTREPRSNRNLRHLIPMVIVAVAFVALWELIVQLHIWERYLFPGPDDVARSLLDIWNRGLLLRSIAATLVRLSVGFLISLMLGAILAFLMVHFATFGKGIQPYVLGLQTFPSIAWVPLSLIWFGFSESALLFVTIIGSLFAVSVSFAIFTSSSLSFLGLGIPPPTPDWGGMVRTGYDFLAINPLLSLGPGAAVGLTVMGFYLVGSSVE